MKLSGIFRSAVLAWTMCGCIILFTLVAMVNASNNAELGDNPLQNALLVLGQQLPTIVFGIVGALIIGQQPRNTIGWLLMLISFPVALLTAIPTTRILSQFTASGQAPTLGIWLLIWINGWGWWFLIGPLLLIPILFPTGRPPSPRWRWVIGALGAVFLTFLTLLTFIDRFKDFDLGVDFANPIGFIPFETEDAFFNGPWGIVLGIITILCVSAIFVRYRRAGFVERQQIKWLLFAFLFFALVYAPGFLNEGDMGVLFNIGFYLGVLAVPTAIGIAILRYRLFDIDVIIRRTLTYAFVTAALVLVFFGSVLVLQQIFSTITGAGQNEIVTVLSTLAIAALFVPVRSRIQTEIDRRFNRKKYDAQQVLSDFAATVRDETDLASLTGRLMQVVDETMQPRSVSVWLKKENERRAN